MHWTLRILLAATAIPMLTVAVARLIVWHADRDRRISRYELESYDD